MQVKDIMTRNVQCIAPNVSLRQAAQMMKEMDIGPLPICENDRLIGMLTDRDIVLRGVAEGYSPDDTAVREVMTPGVSYCFEDQDIAEAAELMQDKQIRRVVVLNRDKRLVGIVSLGDLAVDTGDDELSGHTLEAVSEPAMPSA